MKQVWVIGAGGMLGSALIKLLRYQNISLYKFPEAFDWSNPERIKCQFKMAVKGFMAGLSSSDDWVIYWVAGGGYLGSTKYDMERETAALDALLIALRDQIPGCRARGLIGFASSAGALYAGCLDFEITEASEVSATSDYARAKWAQERLLEDFVSAVDKVQLLVARFSTLYGPGQASGKQQGLLSHIARCALRHQPVEIFVPLDTSRDYLFVHDAASDFLAYSRALRAHDVRFVIKIIAAERSVTTSDVISTFNKLMKKRLLYVCNRNHLSNLYLRRVAYRSISPLNVGTELTRHTLVEGVAVILGSERMSYILSAHKGES